MKTEEIYKVFDIYEKGMYIFGGKKKFTKWLNTPSIYFSGKKPIELALEEILEELNRIEYSK